MPKISKIQVEGVTYDVATGAVTSVNGKTGAVDLIASDIPYDNSTLDKAIEKKADKTELKTKLSELAQDSTHRTATDVEKEKWNNKVDKVEGKVLSTNDFTQADKNKIQLIDSKADKSALQPLEQKIKEIKPYNYIKLIVLCADKTPTRVSKVSNSSSYQDVISSNGSAEFEIDEYGQYTVNWWSTSGGTGYTTITIDEAKTYTIDITEHTKAPGNKNLMRGDMDRGYFGVVTNGLPSGTELANLCGITAGTAQYDNEGYLKFAYKGKILFKSKKPFRYNISWDDINSKGCVFGKEITHNGVKYKVRLMEGHDINRQEKVNLGGYMTFGRNCYHSEWNMLMLPIHEQAKNYNWDAPIDVDNSEIPNDWNINFSDKDLLVKKEYGNGNCQWCQEAVRSENNLHLCRGYSSVTNAGQASKADNDMGWSPVLEVVE